MKTTESTPYIVIKTSGMWEVFFRRERVRTFATEAVARCYAAAWNANRQPRPHELSAALRPAA